MYFFVTLTVNFEKSLIARDDIASLFSLLIYYNSNIRDFINLLMWSGVVTGLFLFRHNYRSASLISCKRLSTCNTCMKHAKSSKLCKFPFCNVCAYVIFQLAFIWFVEQIQKPTDIKPAIFDANLCKRIDN